MNVKTCTGGKPRDVFANSAAIHAYQQYPEANRVTHKHTHAHKQNKSNEKQKQKSTSAD